MKKVVELSRIDIDACGPFLEGVPERAVHSPDDPWWESAEASLLYDACCEAVRIFGEDEEEGSPG